jgi:hypothetical protein
MKLALLFSGQPRFINSASYDSIKRNFLEKYDCDVYAHFWFSPDPTTVYETSEWSTLGNLTFPTDTIDVFTSLYSPKAISYDPPPKESEIVLRPYPKVSNQRTPYNFLCLNESQKKVYQLVQTPEQYTFIIWIRSDSYIYRLPDITEWNPSSIYLAGQDLSRNVFNVSILFLPPLQAKLFYEGLYKIDSICDSDILPKFVHEEIFYCILQVQGLLSSIQIIPYPRYNFGIVREGRIAPCLPEP